MKNIFEKPRGQVMVLYAAAMAFMLCGAVALGTDVAVMYVNWQHSQKTVDAAAVAGANYLNGTSYTGTVDPSCGGQPDSASKAACTYAVKNGLAASALTISEPPPSTIKVVASETTLPYFFGQVLGLSTYTVASSSTAVGGGTVKTVLGSLSNGTNLGMVPLGLQCATPCPAGSFVAGQSVSFGNKFISSTIDLPGNWDWLALDGGGGKTLKDDLANGATTPYSATNPDGSCPGPGSCTVFTKPGGTNGPVSKGISDRFSGCPSIADPCNGGTANNIPAGDPCLVVVPVVDFAAANKAGRTSMPIETFAEVYLNPATTTGSHIDGCFVSAVQGGTLSGTTTTTTSNTFVGATAPPTITN
jgi:Putative Flp pilus-assembly TadE/G-like